MVVPELQHLAPGDFVPDGAPETLLNGINARAERTGAGSTIDDQRGSGKPAKRVGSTVM